MPRPCVPPLVPPAPPLRALLSQYAAGSAVTCDPVDQGLLNRGYRLCTTRGRYFLKHHFDPETADPAAIARQHRATERLAVLGVPVAPPLPGRDGRTVAVVGGHAYALHPWIEGRHRHGGQLTPEQCGRLGALLGVVHASLERVMSAEGRGWAGERAWAEGRGWAEGRAPGAQGTRSTWPPPDSGSTPGVWGAGSAQAGGRWARAEGGTQGGAGAPPTLGTTERAAAFQTTSPHTAHRYASGPREPDLYAPGPGAVDPRAAGLHASGPRDGDLRASGPRAADPRVTDLRASAPRAVSLATSDPGEAAPHAPGPREAAPHAPSPRPAGLPAESADPARTFALIDDLLTRVRRHRPADSFDELARHRLLERRALLEQHADRRPPRGGCVGWVHGDFHPFNLLYQGDAPAAIVDWDRLGVQPRAEEAVRAAAIFFVRPAGALDLPKVRAYARAYRRTAGVTPSELTAAVHRVWWERLNDFWMLRWHYERGDTRADSQFPAASALAVWWTREYEAVCDAFAG